MAQGCPRPGEKYLHFKNRLYQIIAVAYHSETMEPYVVYQALYGDFKVYIRPYEMFVSEVDHEKYPQVTQKYRFQYLEPEEKNGETEENREIQTDQTAESCGSGSGSHEGSGNQPQEQEIPAQEAAVGEAEGFHLNPWLDKILDASGFEEKYKIVCDMQGDVTDRLIDDIAVVMDFAIPEGDLRERYAQLKHCIRTRQKYESGRLR